MMNFDWDEHGIPGYCSVLLLGFFACGAFFCLAWIGCPFSSRSPLTLPWPLAFPKRFPSVGRGLGASLFSSGFLFVFFFLIRLS